MEKIFLPYLDTVCDEVTLEFEHESKQDIIKMKPRSAKSPYIKEKIASVNHLFQLQKRLVRTVGTVFLHQNARLRISRNYQYRGIGKRNAKRFR